MPKLETFASIVTGPIAYEEIHQRCLDFIEKEKLKSATIEIMYLAEENMAYGVWVKWYSGFWIFKKPNYRNSLFGIREDDRQPNILGYNVDIDAKTTYTRTDSWFGDQHTKVHTVLTKAVGITQEAIHVFDCSIGGAGGETTHLLPDQP